MNRLPGLLLRIGALGCAPGLILASCFAAGPEATVRPGPSPTAAATDQLSLPSMEPTAPATIPGAEALGPTTAGRVENFVEVGHDALEGRGWNAGLALQYPCAYIGSRRPYIGIEDVSDPARPAYVGDFLFPFRSEPVEVRTVPDLDLLVVLNFALNPSVMTYDVQDCREPRPIGSLGLGAVGHEFFLWRDPAEPARLLMFVAMFQPSGPDLMVVDLTEADRPSLIGTWSSEDEGISGRLHSLSLSPDGRRAYLAVSEVGLLVADAGDFAENAPRPELRLRRHPDGTLAPAPGAGTHSAVLLSDRRHVLVTQEVYECPFAGLFLSDIADETQPLIVGRFALPENDPACDSLPQPDAVFTAHNPLPAQDLVFVTWYGGGLQAISVEDPARPRRVGLFVPRGEGAAAASYAGTYPVQMWSYPILRQGLIYVTDIQGGLYILRYTGPGAERLEGLPLVEGNASSWPPP